MLGPLLSFFDEVNLVQTQSLPIGDLWFFLPFGYIVTILIETPILVLGLPRKLTVRQKLLCGVWLTACTYPIVVLVLPSIFFGAPRWEYLAVAETFAPVGECFIFWLAFRTRELLHTRDWIRSFVIIVIANIGSFSVGEILNYFGWFGLL
ncbi:MAG: hypothetical protein ABI481_02135 [Pyrinomonadaceae bacterium]